MVTKFNPKREFLVQVRQLESKFHPASGKSFGEEQAVSKKRNQKWNAENADATRICANSFLITSEKKTL